MPDEPAGIVCAIVMEGNSCYNLVSISESNPLAFSVPVNELYCSQNGYFIAIGF